MKKVVRFILVVPTLFVLALLFGGAIFYALAVVASVVAGHTDSHFDARATAGFVLMMIFVGGTIFSIPGFFTALIAAALLPSPRLRLPAVFAPVAAGIAVINFYVYIMLCQHVEQVRAQAQTPFYSPPPFSLLPRDRLAQHVLVIAPFAFAGAAFVASSISQRLLGKSSRSGKSPTNDT